MGRLSRALLAARRPLAAEPARKIARRPSPAAAVHASAMPVPEPDAPVSASTIVFTFHAHE
jgi:hypothetical protein